MSWEGMDRRKFPRVIYPCMVKVIAVDGTQEVLLTHTENIGQGGISVTVKQQINLFTPVELEIDLLDIGEHIKAEGKVVWNVRRKNSEDLKPLFYDLGIEFTDMSKRDHDLLQKDLEELIRNGTKLSKPFL